MTKTLLSASILSANFRRLESEIHAAEDAGVDWIHIDVMDGQFVPNISMGPFIVEFCREITPLPLDVHLMIVEPEKHISTFASAGATYLTIHPENNPNTLRTLQEIRSLGCNNGLALNPGTPTIMATTLLEFLDMVLIMTVNPGYSGQKFIPNMTRKITEIKNKIVDLKLETQVQVDGGISPSNIKSVIIAGADIVVSASSIFKNPDGIRAGIASLREGYG